MNNITSSQIACIIVTFNPDSNIYNSISRLIEQSGMIVIVDNGSSNDTLDGILKRFSNVSLNIINNSENLGIATALNQGIDYAIKSGFEWFVTFDQDTVPNHNAIKLLVDAFNALPEKNIFGALGLNYLNKYRSNKHNNLKSNSVRSVSYLITSGCLINRHNYLKCGSFPDHYFIDNVDIEFSLRLRKHKKKLYLTEDIGMNHCAGNPKQFGFLGNLINYSNHNSQRRFFMARNHILVLREYFIDFPYFCTKLSYFFIMSLIKILLFEDSKLNKLHKTFKGLIEGIKFKR